MSDTKQPASEQSSTPPTCEVIDPVEWYRREQPVYSRLAESVKSTLTSALIHAGIPFVDVACRPKEPESFKEKIDRKGYKNPQEQMTDLAGIRVIAFTESDVERVKELIDRAFHIHLEKSLDKGAELGKDRFGYRSVHFVCDLGDRRLTLDENTPFQNRVFEIQVRTVLQHAWAEIQHDRGYKFEGVLPADIERRLYAQAAILESVDREFDRLAREVDKHAKVSEAKTAAGDLDIEITSASLSAYVANLADLHDLSLIRMRGSKLMPALIMEMHNLGVLKINQLQKYFSEDYIASYNKYGLGGSNTDLVFTRRALMYEDLQRYVNESRFTWDATALNSYDVMKGKYDIQEVIDALLSRGVTINE